jgi:hypothetical protein
MNNDMAIIFCLSLREFPIKPDDVSPSIPVPCPLCNNAMWLSEKKKFWLEKCRKDKRDVLYCCSDCLPRECSRMSENGDVDENTNFVKVEI